MKEKNISEMVKAYNEAETLQEARLFDLFKEIKKRKGYRKVSFSSGAMWSNCWDKPETLDRKLFLNDFTRKITEVNAGEK